jgi:hypothetical protein
LIDAFLPFAFTVAPEANEYECIWDAWPDVRLNITLRFGEPAVPISVIS